MNTLPANKLRVLFVDDEPPIRDVMKIELPRMGHEATICEDGTAAIAAIDKHSFDVAIVDLRMPGLSGWDVVDHLKSVSPDTEVIISTGHGSMEEAIQALRRGAYDFLPKPCKLFEIANVLKRVGEKLALTRKTDALERRLESVEGDSSLVGDTQSMRRVKQLIDKIAPTDSTVLILGETGTGKELVARRIHDLSLRAGGPFVAVNCGALPENLVESEFFGHRKGAFTGADSPRKGLFEVAHGGTLFLDELGELDKAMQVKVLRFLESGEVRRVGENEVVPRRCPNRLCHESRPAGHGGEGTFREDLFFRVNTFEIHLAAAARAERGHPRPGPVLARPLFEAAAGTGRHSFAGRARGSHQHMSGAATSASSPMPSSTPSSSPTARRSFPNTCRRASPAPRCVPEPLRGYYPAVIPRHFAKSKWT